MEKVYAKICVKGRVQGVFFRRSTQKEAQNLHVTGYVVNKADKSVLIEVWGTKDNVDNFIRWCHKGPASAHVEQVEIERGVMKERFETFEIR